MAQIVSQLIEGAIDRFGAADQDMIGAGKSSFRQDLRCERPESPLDSVTNDRAADLLGDGNAQPHGGIVILAPAHQQDEGGGGGAKATVGGEEIRAPPELAEAAWS